MAGSGTRPDVRTPRASSRASGFYEPRASYAPGKMLRKNKGHQEVALLLSRRQSGPSICRFGPQERRCFSKPVNGGRTARTPAQAPSLLLKYATDGMTLRSEGQKGSPWCGRPAPFDLSGHTSREGPPPFVHLIGAKLTADDLLLLINSNNHMTSTCEDKPRP